MMTYGELIPMTHGELILRAEKWLKAFGCGVVFRDFVTSGPETPDAIGWKFGYSVMIECKASRSDFHSDKRKSFRKHPEQGVGEYRLYLCPPSVITPEDLPDGWGLLWARGKRIERVVCWEGNHPAYDGPVKRQEFSARHEIAMLLSALRRLKLRGHFDEIYDKHDGEVMHQLNQVGKED